MKAHRVIQVSISILMLAALLFGLIPVQSVRATSLAWEDTGPLQTARSYHTATLLNNGKVLVVGGIGGGAGAELYDPDATTWTFTDPLSIARTNHTATLLSNGKVLVVGGISGSNPLASAELYDPATGHWSITPLMSTSRYFHTATLLTNGQVLVVGGVGKDSQGISRLLASAELYDPATNTWSLTSSLNASRNAHTATLLPNGRVLVAGGNNKTSGAPSGALDTTELYTPNTGTWETVTDRMTSPRFYHTATMLSNGNVLVVGGCDKFGYLNTSELYNSVTGEWAPTIGQLQNGPRFSQAATLISNYIDPLNTEELVLVSGGLSTGGLALSSSELYDLTQGTWETTAGPLTAARSNHTGTQLFTGQVLATGGTGASGLSLATAELFDPTPPNVPPLVPLLISPSGNTNTEPSYLWHHSRGATSYHLVVQTSSSAPVIDTVLNTSYCSGGICTYHPLAPLAVGNYKFEVSAKNGCVAYAGCDTSVFSAWMTFTVKTDYYISGNVGTAGATLNYYDVKWRTAQADGNGDYSLRVSYDWTGTVTPSKVGYIFTPENRPYANVLASLTGQNYTAQLLTYTISGNASVAGATLNYTGGTPVTAGPDGSYTITVNYGWSGTVTPFLIGYAFTPSSKSYTNVTADQTQNYSAIIANYTISGNAGLDAAVLSYTDGTDKTATAAANGNYSFSVRAGWTGTITPAKSGYFFTPTIITVATPLTADLPDQNFTASVIPYTISGSLGVGGANASVAYTGGSTTANASGDYSFTISYGWTGTITPSKPGYDFTPISIIISSPVTGDLTGKDFTASIHNYIVSGSMGANGANATVAYTGGSTSANGSGDYSFAAPFGWTGTITPTKTQYTFTPTSITITNPVSADLPGQNFTAIFTPYTVSGSLGANGANASVAYTGGSTSANASGNYTFAVVSGWTGTITPTKPGYYFTPTSITITIPVTADLPGQNFTTTILPYTVSGSLGVNGANATVAYTGGSTSANVSGDYSFAVASGWTGTITPSKTGYIFTPTSITITIPVTSNLSGQDFITSVDTYRVFLPLIFR